MGGRHRGPVIEVLESLARLHVHVGFVQLECRRWCWLDGWLRNRNRNNDLVGASAAGSSTGIGSFDVLWEEKSSYGDWCELWQWLT
jgi:hypothetical protein